MSKLRQSRLKTLCSFARKHTLCGSISSAVPSFWSCKATRQNRPKPPSSLPLRSLRFCVLGRFGRCNFPSHLALRLFLFWLCFLRFRFLRFLRFGFRLGLRPGLDGLGAAALPEVPVLLLFSGPDPGRRLFNRTPRFPKSAPRVTSRHASDTQPWPECEVLPFWHTLLHRPPLP